MGLFTQTLNNKLQYDGKEYAVVSNPFDSSTYITVKDENGNIVMLNKKEALFNFYQKGKEDRENRIAKYQAEGREYEALQAVYRNEVKEIRAEMGLCLKGSEEYTALNKKLWGKRMDATSAGNRSFSAFLQAFMIASDTSWA